MKVKTHVKAGEESVGWAPPQPDCSARDNCINYCYANYPCR
jgi:hypothetical protein